MITVNLFMDFDPEKIKKRCEVFGYKGSTSEELIKFYMEHILNHHVLGYIEKDLNVDFFGEPNIAWDFEEV